MTTIHVLFKMNPGYPTAEEPKHRFDKDLFDSPWADVISGTIYLDDPAWEQIGCPSQLEVTLRGK